MKDLIRGTIVLFRWFVRDVWIRRDQFPQRRSMILHVFKSITVLDARLYGRRIRMKRSGGKLYLHQKQKSKMNRNTSKKVKNKENDMDKVNHI